MAAKKGGRLNWLNISIFLWFATGLACVVPTVLVGPFLFDKPGSSENPFPWLVLGSLISFPVISILSGIGTWVLKSRLKPLAFTASLLPLALIGVIFAGMNLSTLFDSSMKVKQDAVQIGECSSSALDGGDGLATTGCGMLGGGQIGTGTTKSTSEAHDWQFPVQYGIGTTLSIQNDGKSCPQIVLLDASGKPDPAFSKENGPNMCTGNGMIETRIYNLSAPVKGTYTIRVSTPKMPGTYMIKIGR